ncbi:MAG TPA: trigger factor, partial [Bryobacteraceae bacterium]|nr:trigger factor [Bryobacteraceae bacterium]
MPLIEGCKHEIEVVVPIDEIEKETEKVVANIQRRANLPGFRPGKAPTTLIRKRFESEIRQDVLEHVLPKAFRARVEEEHLDVVGTPSVTDVHFHEGEPLRFKAEFEVAPDIELGEYRDIPVPYNEAPVTDEEITERIKQLQERKAEYVNQDPRPIEDGDYAVVSLRSIEGLEGEPIQNDDMMVTIGGEDSLPEFTENLRGASPGDHREFQVTYPEDYAQERVAGKTIRFAVDVKGIRKKELPELNDEFARDLGDYQTFEELREAVRQAIQAEHQQTARAATTEKILDALVERHEFPVPEAYIDRQIETNVESQIRQMTGRSVNLRELNLDWKKIKEQQNDRAIKDV